MVPLATPLDWPEDLYLSHLGFPGEAPYTRGVQPTMYRGRLWTTRIFSGFGTAQETNQRYKYLLAQGNGGLSVAFDLPALYGYDADHPMAAGEVGKCGVAVSSLADMEVLFEGIPLDQVSTSMTITSTAAIALAMYIVVAEKQGVAPAQLRERRSRPAVRRRDRARGFATDRRRLRPPRRPERRGSAPRCPRRTLRTIGAGRSRGRRSAALPCPLRYGVSCRSRAAKTTARSAKPA